MPAAKNTAPKPNVPVAPTPVSSAATAAKTRSLVASAERISAADLRRAEALLKEIARRKARIAEEFYDIGEALRELQHKKLYVALGHGSFGEMLSSRNVMSRSQAHKLIAIVSTLPRDKALTLGSEKSALLVRYSIATPAVDTPEWLLEQGTLPGGKKVADASAREIQAAAQKVRSSPAKKLPPEEVQAQKSARAAQAALRKRGAKGALVSAVRKPGGMWLHIEIPVAAVGILAG
jgi:hypothetical protein